MISVAVLGYGTVGSGVVEVFRQNQEKIDRCAGDQVTDSNMFWILP